MPSSLNDVGRLAPQCKYEENVQNACEKFMKRNDPNRVKRTRMPGRRLERNEQVDLAVWLDMRLGPCQWCHVPNEFPTRGNDDWQGKKYAAGLRAKGRKPGVPDCLIFWVPSRQKFKGVALELKRSDGGTVSPEQEKWHDSLRALGWYVIVAHGAAEAIQRLVALGY